MNEISPLQWRQSALNQLSRRWRNMAAGEEIKRNRNESENSSAAMAAKYPGESGVINIGD
jgi:hypothetical protein